MELKIAINEGGYIMIRVQTPSNWLQTYAEQCKMRQGTPVMADYGLQQDEAATVEISSAGSKKTMASEHQSLTAQFEEQTKAQSEVENDTDVAKGTVVTERSIDKLVETVLGGGEVSAEEAQRLNEKLPKLIRKQYAEMYRFRFSDERDEKEEQEKKLAEEMKNNVFMRQQALKDMKQAVEKKKEEAAEQEAEDAQNADAVANKAAEAQMIEDTLDGFQQEISEGTQGNFQQEDKELVNGKVSGALEDDTISDEQKAAVRKKVLRYDAKNKGNLSALDSQRLEEAQEQKDYSQMLDDSYRMTMQIFDNDDFDISERVAAYQNFVEDSKELAVNREIAAYQKMYDFQAVTDLQIKALSDRGVQTAAKVSSQPQKRLQNQAAVQNQMRSMGQAVVEQAAREKKTAVTDDGKREKASEKISEQSFK